MDGNLSLPNNSCFLALPIYCSVRNFRMHVFCEFVIARLDQKLLDVSLSILGFIVHLLILGNCSAIILRFLSLSYLVMYVSRHLTGPLSGFLIGSGHMSF
jgi:hypothetical protein